jgi:hypothetical protein
MAGKRDILESIGPDEALAVLKELTKEAEIRKKAEKIALEIISTVDVEDVAEQVVWELDSLIVEDVWDKSGSTRDGYIDPGDCAWRMFEEAIEPFLQQARKCRELLLTNEAKLYFMGILKGIHRFETESESEFKDWAVDAPGEFFVSVYDEWKKENKARKEILEMKRFVLSLCPEKGKLCK